MNAIKREKLYQCPYNSYHQVKLSRFQRHIYKCSRQHPTLNLQQCPYNFTHFCKPKEMEEHKISCPDKWKFEKFVSEYHSNFKENIKIRIPKVNYEESWEHYNVKGYDPEPHCLENPVLRSCRGKTKKERRDFYEMEHDRITAIEKTLPR